MPQNGKDEVDCSIFVTGLIHTLKPASTISSLREKIMTEHAEFSMVQGQIGKREKNEGRKRMLDKAVR